MPIAVKCECGSQLEIDEKFLGKEILCPDCQRPLPTKVPATPPPLDIPEYRRTSGLAVLSLSMAIVGFFTLVGSIAAIVLGTLSLKKIKQNPNRLDGTPFARAGIITGAVGLVFTLILLMLPGIIIDGYVRDLLYAGRLQYPSGKTIERSNDIETLRIDRPSATDWQDWGVYTSPTTVTNAFKRDELILINTAENAYIACQKVSLDLEEAAPEARDERRKKALERLQQSELLNMLGRMHNHPFPADEIPFEDKKEDGKAKDDKTPESVFDMNVGGHRRRFLVRWIMKDTKLTVLVAAAPPSRFERLEKDIRESFDKINIK